MTDLVIALCFCDDLSKPCGTFSPFLSFTIFTLFPSFPQPPASPARTLDGLLHAAWMGGVSRVSQRIPAPCQSKLEQVCPQRSHHLHQAHPPGPRGQPRLWKWCGEGQGTKSKCFYVKMSLLLIDASAVIVSCFRLFQVFSNGDLISVLCGKREFEELQSIVNPLLVSAPGGCLSLSFHSDYSNPKRHTGFRGFYTDQGEKWFGWVPSNSIVHVYNCFIVFHNSSGEPSLYMDVFHHCGNFCIHDVGKVIFLDNNSQWFIIVKAYLETVWHVFHVKNEESRNNV